MRELRDVLMGLSDAALIGLRIHVNEEISKRRNRKAREYEEALEGLITEIENDGYEVEIGYSTNEHCDIDVTDIEEEEEE